MPHEPATPAPGRPPATATDRLLDRMGVAAHLCATLAVYAIAIAAFGLALAPALWLVHRALAVADAQTLQPLLRWPFLGLAGAAAFFVFGLTLMLVVAVLNFLLPTRIRPHHGTYYSLGSVPWFLHNALFYLVRYTFLPFASFTPFEIWFLRAMGMKIGRRVQINSEYLSDPQLLTLGDHVVVGGSVRLFAHSGGGGHLNIDPVVIADRVTLGLGCTVMGGVTIGPGATILPHTVLLPGSRVGAGETWGGVPGRPIPHEEMERLKALIHGRPAAAPPPG